MSRAMLTREELVAETVYGLMRQGRMDRSEYCRRMDALDASGPDGVVATCYCTWALLQQVPESPERAAYSERMRQRLRAALEELQSV